MNFSYLEQRLAEHAERSGLGNVRTVDNDDDLAYLLIDNSVMSQNINEYLDDVIGNKKYKSLLKKEPDEVAILGRAGVYTTPQELQAYDISHEDFLKYLYVDIKKGLALINGSLPFKESRIFVQLHETIHARDHENGFHHLKKGTIECQAYELLTETRTLLFAQQVLDESCFDFLKLFEEQKIRSGYLGLNNANMNAIKSISQSLDPRTDMAEILGNLVEHLDWTHGRNVQDLLLKAPAYDNDFPKDMRREAVRIVLDNLISLEEGSTLPSVVPMDLEGLK